MAWVNKKAARGERLSVGAGERIVGVAKLLGQFEEMLESADDVDRVEAMAWMSQWLRKPLPAIGGAWPIDLLDTIEGQALVSLALSLIRSGTYA